MKKYWHPAKLALRTPKKNWRDELLDKLIPTKQGREDVASLLAKGIAKGLGL